MVTRVKFKLALHDSDVNFTLQSLLVSYQINYQAITATVTPVLQ